MAQLGVVAGIQVLVTIQQARGSVVGEADSYSVAYLVGAAAAGLGVAAACFVLPRRRGAAPAEVRTDQARQLELADAT